MPVTQRQIEADLRFLAHRLRVGMAKLHPATEKELNAARQAARQQWERRQRLAQRQTKVKSISPARPVEQTQPAAKAHPPKQAHDLGPSH